MMKSVYQRLTKSFSRPAKVEIYPRVDVFSWQPGDGRINFGDCLANIVVDRVLMAGGRTRHDETVVAKRLLAIGSVLHFAESGDVIWGSGVNGKIPKQMHRFESLDVRAVRGPLTADFLVKRGIQVPKIYGDPGLLIPHLFPRFVKRTANREYSFVPNLHDLVASRQQPNTLSPLWGWNVVIDHIIRSKFIVASSLHGLVIAEAYGIPARYVRLSPSEDIFKYQDYYYGTGRENFTFATSVKEALEMGGMPPPIFDHQRLLDAFPWDLWSVPETDEILR